MSNSGKDDPKFIAGMSGLVWSNAAAPASNTKPGEGRPIQSTLAEGYGSPVSDPDLADDVRVHRIMPFAGRGLESVVANQELVLVTPDLWSDKHEGFLAQELKTRAGISKVALLLQQKGLGLHPSLTAAMLHEFLQGTYMQCWTAAAEKPSMWGEYSGDGASVRVTTTLGKIRRAAYLGIYKVEYRDTLSLEEEIEQIFPTPDLLLQLSYPQIFRRKRKKYDYEEEIRLMHCNVGFTNSSSNPKLYPISFAHVADFIESVVVDPRATDDVTSVIEKFCTDNGIAFAGRSSLQMPVNSGDSNAVTD